MKQKHNLFSKTIALAMAILIASTTLTGCSWFSSRQDESSQEVVLEAPNRTPRTRERTLWTTLR